MADSDKDLENRLKGSDTGAQDAERREEAFKAVKRSEDLQAFLDRAKKEGERDPKSCPRCRSKKYTARSTQYYLIFHCPECGQDWHANVVPNSLGPRLPPDPMQPLLDKVPKHRDPRKVWSQSDE